MLLMDPTHTIVNLYVLTQPYSHILGTCESEILGRIESAATIRIRIES